MKKWGREKEYIYMWKKKHNTAIEGVLGEGGVLKDERGDLFLPACVWPSVSSHV